MPTGSGGQASNQLRLMEYKHVHEDSRAWIEAAMHFDYQEENNKGTQWLPGGIHLRVWPYDNLRTIVMWILVLPNEDIRIFSDRQEAQDACVLRDLSPGFSEGSPITGIETVMEKKSGKVAYFIKSDFNGVSNQLVLSYQDMMKFLGPSDESIKAASKHPHVDKLAAPPKKGTPDVTNSSHSGLPRPQLKPVA